MSSLKTVREHYAEKYRWLRVGETMQESDKMFDAFGDLIPIRPAMVGHKVLGHRHGEPDNVLRLRLRKPSNTPTP